jgi:hypothetical protein
MSIASSRQKSIQVVAQLSFQQKLGVPIPSSLDSQVVLIRKRPFFALADSQALASHPEFIREKRVLVVEGAALP